MLQIENLTVVEKTLTLDYQVSNPFKHDIWVCEDINVDGIDHLETRIDAETVWIKLRSNLESNVRPYEAALAKYRFLSPGESYSGRILLNLPIRNASPVYDFDEDRKKHKHIILHSAVFEVGYFEGDLFNMLSERIERGKSDTTGNIDLQIEALMLENMEQPQSSNTVYLPQLWPGRRMEKSAKVVVADVDIPCSVAIEDK